MDYTPSANANILLDGTHSCVHKVAYRTVFRCHKVPISSCLSTGSIALHVAEEYQSLPLDDDSKGHRAYLRTES